MKRSHAFRLAIVGIPVFSLLACGGPSPTEKLAEELAKKAEERIRAIDPKEIEAGLREATNRLSPEQRERIKAEGRKLLDRL